MALRADDTKALSNWLRAKRLEKALTLDQMHYATGVKSVTWSRIERGVSQPTTQTVYRICKGLGVELPALVRELQLEKSVDLTKLVSPSKKASLLTHADIMGFLTRYSIAKSSMMELVSRLSQKSFLAYTESGLGMAAPDEHGPSFAVYAISLLLSDENKFYEFRLKYPTQFDTEAIFKVNRSGGALWNDDLSVAIRELRKSRKLDVNQLAQSVGLSGGIINRMETGNIEAIKLNTILKLDQELGAKGELLGMVWSIEGLRDRIYEYHKSQNGLDRPKADLANREGKLISILITVYRWWQCLRDNDSEWIKEFREGIKRGGRR